MLGEDNIQTARHYGNLGRLYQSMKMYKSAEKMHRRAIRIKVSSEQWLFMVYNPCANHHIEDNMLYATLPTN